MSKKFTSVKALTFGLFLICINLAILFLAVGYPWISGNIHSMSDLLARIFMGMVLPSFSLWIWFGTSYTLDKDILTAKSGPQVFKIPVSLISVVRLNQKIIGGLWKPTLSWNSIQIEYNKFDSVFISPEKQDVFIEELLKINPGIEIRKF
jgi:hypothetical protein